MVELATRLPAHARVIIIACDPDTLNDHSLGVISSYLSTERVLLVSRGAAPGSALAKLGVESTQGRFRRRAINRVVRTRPTPDLVL